MSAAGSPAAATTARRGEPRFKAPLPFAVQVVLTKAGKAPRFIPKGQMLAHEDMMNKQGALKTRRLAGAFHIQRYRRPAGADEDGCRTG
jgi:hypothetical protein